jgi:hypothetical protein
MKATKAELEVIKAAINAFPPDEFIRFAITPSFQRALLEAVGIKFEVAVDMRRLVAIRGAKNPKTGRGRRRYGKFEKIQLALWSLHGHPLPPDLSGWKELKRVNDWLRDQHFAVVDRDTVQRAIDAQREPDLWND